MTASTYFTRAFVTLAMVAGTTLATAQTPPAAPAPRAKAAPRARMLMTDDARAIGAADVAALASLASLSELSSLSATQAGVAAALDREFAALDTRSLGDLRTLSELAELPRGSRATRTPWTNDQVVDSLYRQARERMNRGDYKTAADLFMAVAKRAGTKPLAGDALYWGAYSLYRDGSSGSLASALSSLDRLGRDFPSASTLGDADALRMRVCGEMARRGDAQCAEQVTSSADGQGASAGSGRSSGQGRAGARGSASAGGQSRASSSNVQGCPDEDDDERIAALNALLQMDADRALPILEKVLARRDKCSVTLRRKAVFLVSQKGDARSADILMGAVRGDPDAEVREQAVFWLGQTKDERAVDMLQEILQKDSNDEVLDKAVFALSQHRSERAGVILRDLAQRNGAPLKVREQAIFWLGQQRNAENGTLLKNLYKKVSEEELKEKIIFSLSQNRGDGNAKWLLDVATDAKEPIEMRKKALFWAGQSRDVSMADLSAMYARIDDREMKDQIIFVFSQRRGSDAVDKLIEIAKTEKDKELRKKAIFWLSQSRDPRVAKFLEELIG